VVGGYVLAVAFKWSPSTQHHLRALSVPVWAVLLFYLGEPEWKWEWGWR